MIPVRALHRLGLPTKAQLAAVYVIALLAGGAAIAVDWLTPRNLIITILACAVVPLAIPTKNRWFLWGLTLILAMSAFAVALWGRESNAPTRFAGVPIWQLNRGLTVFAILLSGVVSDFLLRSRRTISAQLLELAGRTAELEEAQAEVAAREEELSRQNEEMQAQNEELERQSEELRVTNEELGRREKTLERLLDLSRALAAETTQLNDGEVMSRICEAIVQLTDADAGAILMQEGSELIIRCQHGMDSSAVHERLPFDATFAALVMSRLQTGYIEDLRRRTDLVVPAAWAGRGFRSILATPLRVRGRLIGVVELYSSEPRSWTGEQIALAESLTAQASVSLEAVDLFAEIQQERRKFETTFRTLPLPVFVAEDAGCQRVRINPAASVLLNASMDSNLSPFASAAVRPRVQLLRNGQMISETSTPLARACLRGEQILNEEYDILLSSGERRTLLISASPVFDRTGAVAGAVSVAADVSTLKRLQQEIELRRREAEEASLRKTRFLAAISHDIRTPVNAISLTAELIRRAAPNEAMRHEVPSMVTDLQSNAQALSVLVNDLLDVARFDTGKVEFQDSEFSLGELIADEIRQLLPLAQEKGLSLTTDSTAGGASSVWLRTDRVKLGRILANLVGNAIKFTERGGITLRVVRWGDSGGVSVIVCDTGVGIAAEHLSRIFDEFTQLRNPERDRYKGTGLGLAISRRLVEAVGGTISVESRPGEGSTFTVTLPESLVVSRVQGGPRFEGPAGRSGPILTGLRVLLVEDHATTRWATAQILASEGAKVRDVATGAEALAALEAAHDGHPVDALLLDMMLPDMDGQDVLRRANAARPPTLQRIIVLTGDCTPERAAAVKSLGADALMSKPIDIPYLLSLLGPARDAAR